MDNSGSEDEDFIIKRKSRVISPIVPHISDTAEPHTPPTDYSDEFKSSLGLIVTPTSPPYRKVRSMTLVEQRDTPKVSRRQKKHLLCPPSLFSTSTPNPVVRSLKVQRSKGVVNDRLNASMGDIPTSLLNPFTPTSVSRTTTKHSAKNTNSAKKNGFESDEEDRNGEDGSHPQVKKPKLKDFDDPRFDKNYLVESELGVGVHGCVMKCLHLLSGTFYAIKRSLRPVNNERVARNEIFAHAALHHPNIVAHYDSWIENDFVFLKNEYCNGGSLEKQVRLNAPLPEKDLLLILEHVAEGLKYMHSRNLAHMDIKPGNIFIKIEPRLNCGSDDAEDDSELETTSYKIGDLGHIVKLNCSKSVEEGDCRYMPREMLNWDSSVDLTKVDIFSLGLTLYEAGGSGELPKNGEEWHKIRDGHLKNLPHLSPRFNDLLKSMVDPDPKKRPSASDLLKAVTSRVEISNLKLEETINLLRHRISYIESMNNKMGILSPDNIKHYLSPQSISDRCTRSSSRLVKKKQFLKTRSFYNTP